MKKTSLLLIIISFISCDKQDSEWVCSCEETQKVSSFITANMKNSNNMSDEEMEDVIKELRNTAIKINCHQEIMWQSSSGEIDWQKTKLDSCETYQNLY